MSLEASVVGNRISETGTIVKVDTKGDVYEITFESTLDFVSSLKNLAGDTDAVSLTAGYAGSSTGPGPGPGPDPVPPGDTVTAGTFLGYDKDKALWVPQTLDVSGGGVTDLSDYYTKDQVDAKIDVELGDYYTKGQIDASQAAQDSRLSALEAGGGGGGGSVDLSDYYTKTETYSQAEVDQYITAEIAARVEGDNNLQEQIDAIGAGGGGGGGSPDPQTGLNTVAIAKNKQDIEAINDDQAKQDKAIGDLEDAVIEGFGNRYTKDEVDEKFDALEDTDLSGLMVTDGRNKVTETWRLVNEDNTTTYLSTFEGELGLYNVKDPQNDVHGVNKRYTDAQDAETLQAAKDYADAIDVPDIDLDDYYTKSEVDASQAAQDATASDLADAVGAMGAKVDKNAVDIEAIEASSVENLNDLSDVSMSTRSRWKTRDTVGQEELSYSCQFKGYNKNSGRITDGNWGFERGVLFLSKTIFYGSEPMIFTPICWSATRSICRQITPTALCLNSLIGQRLSASMILNALPTPSMIR